MPHQKHKTHGYHLKDAQGRMSVQEIVREQLAKMGQEDRFKEAYAGLHKLLETNKWRILRSGNSLFLYEILGNGECRLQIINADSEENLLKNAEDAIRSLIKANMQKIDAIVEDSKLINHLNSVGFQFQQTNTNEYTMVVSK